MGPRFEPRQSGPRAHRLHPRGLPAARRTAVPSLSPDRADPAVAHSMSVTQLGALSAYSSRQVWGFICLFYKHSRRRYHPPRGQEACQALGPTGDSDCPQEASILLKKKDQGSLHGGSGTGREEAQGSTGHACPSLSVKVGFLEKVAFELGSGR